MLYSHEIYLDGTVAAMRHWREQEMPSGIISAKEIARTQAIRRNILNGFHTRDGLAIPSAMETRKYGSARTDSGERIDRVPDKVLCEDLDDFVKQGVERWDDIVTKLGNISRVDLHLGENMLVQEHTSPNGLIIVDQSPSVEFLSYAPSVDEIEALESMVSRIQIPEQEDPARFGMYL